MTYTRNPLLPNEFHDEVKFDFVYRRRQLITIFIKDHTSLKVTSITIPEIVTFTSFTDIVRVATRRC